MVSYEFDKAACSHMQVFRCVVPVAPGEELCHPYLDAAAPTGRTAIAEMRLVVQVQTAANQRAVHAAFWQLPDDEREVGSLTQTRARLAPTPVPFRLSA